MTAEKNDQMKIKKKLYDQFTVILLWNCHESGCHFTTSLAPHYSCTSPTDCISHPPLHQSHSCHQSLICPDCLTTPAPHSHTHISSTLPCTHCEVLFSTVWHFQAVSLCLPGLPIRLWPFAVCLLTLPAVWYTLCLPPAPTFALPLLLILPCLRYTCYCLWTLPVWPPLVYQ